MSDPTRRRFIGATAASVLSLGALAPIGRAAAAEPTLILGGGAAGCHAALALAKGRAAGKVILIERDPRRLTADMGQPAPFSPPPGRILQDRLAAAGVQILLDEAVAVDWTARRAELFSGRRVPFGTLIAAPGVTAREEGIGGMDALARHLWPAAWGSAREGRRLAGQLAALPEHGHVVLRLPPEAGGAPEIAVARIQRIAEYLETARPGARFTVLDPDESSVASRLFAAQRHAPGAARVTWLDRGTGGRVLSVDAPAGLLETNSGTLRADLVNFIPLQQAAGIAQSAGLADDSGWCPCDGDGRSSLRSDALVLGDARWAARRTASAAAEDGLRGVASL